MGWAGRVAYIGRRKICMYRIWLVNLVVGDPYQILGVDDNIL